MIGLYVLHQNLISFFYIIHVAEAKNAYNETLNNMLLV